jgi:taurine dioxygenase
MTQLPEVHRTGGLIGAEIRGLDLTREYPEETYAAVRQAWAEHGVIFFRDQHLTAGQRQALALRFGAIKTTQQLRKEPDQTRNVGESWHADMTCFDEPPVGTILFAEECPPFGGDTLWAGMGPAFENLSEGLRHTLTGLHAIHANVRKLGPSSTSRPRRPSPRSPSTTRRRARCTRWSR